MECARPAVIEGEGLGEGLANDIACLVRIEEFGVKRNDFNCEGGALGSEVRIEGFQMKEDCLFSLEHLFCALAGNGDENEMFLVHDNTMFKNLTTTLTTSSAGEQHTPAAWGSLWTRFYNNAAKIFGAEGVLRRRLRNREVMLGIKKVEDPVNQSLPLMCFY